MRVAVFGAPCSGKSTFTATLGEACRLPVTHLDDIFHRAGWEPAQAEGFERQVRRIANADSWVVEGNYGRVRPVSGALAQVREAGLSVDCVQVTRRSADGGPVTAKLRATLAVDRV